MESTSGKMVYVTHELLRVTWHKLEAWCQAGPTSLFFAASVVNTRPLLHLIPPDSSHTVLASPDCNPAPPSPDFFSQPQRAAPDCN
eukprot:1156472-Pelagomonas_calceolata.AAC.3